MNGNTNGSGPSVGSFIASFFDGKTMLLLVTGAAALYSQWVIMGATVAQNTRDIDNLRIAVAGLSISNAVQANQIDNLNATLTQMRRMGP